MRERQRVNDVRERERKIEREREKKKEKREKSWGVERGEIVRERKKNIKQRFY